MKRLTLILAILLLVAAAAIGVLVNQKSQVNDDLTAARGNLAAAQKEAVDKAAALQTELDAKTQETQALTDKAADLQKQLDEAAASLESSKAAADKKVAELLTMVDTAATDLGAMRTAADTLTQENQALKALTETAQARVDELEKLQAEFANKLSAAEKDLADALNREAEVQKLHEEAMADRDSLEAEIEALKKQPAAKTEAAPEPITVTKQGEIGPVAVTVSFDKDGAITALAIGDEKFRETTGLGAKAKDEAFIQQFIGKVPPLKLRGATDPATAANLIDAITGATGTSTAVVEAINEAYADTGF